MPPRKKPTSTRQKKADLQLKRAIKRGDIEAPEAKKNPRKSKAHRRGPTGNLIGSAADPATLTAIQSARRLQSAFVTLPPKFLEEAKLLASELPLQRPIPNEASLFADTYRHDTADSIAELSCPHRPKWRFDMTKKEVERNEEGLFKKWLEQTDAAVQAWQNPESTPVEGEQNVQEVTVLEESRTMPRSPTYFERNIEVWRQLYVLLPPPLGTNRYAFISNIFRWRVTEISQILLVLLDSRCPLLHFPPSLRRYLAGRKVILVLTKVDIVGPARADAWTEYFSKHYPDFRIVRVESYVEKEARAEHQGRKQFEPQLPRSFREVLVETIRQVHDEMSQPPDKVKSSPTRLQNWKPTTKQNIDWDGVLRVGASHVSTSRAREVNEDESDQQLEDKEPEFLTIGLIGKVRLFM